MFRTFTGGSAHTAPDRLDGAWEATVRSGGVTVREALRPEAALGAAVVATGGAFLLLTGDDWGDDLATSLSDLPWPAVVAALLLPVIVVVHFVCAAVALRAVSGRRLALRATTLAQLAAAATNRLVPNGIGGAGVNLRYLLRVGVAPGAASSSLAALAVVGAATDAAYVGAVSAFGPAVGLSGGAHELHALAAGGLHAGSHPALILLAGAGLAVLLAACRRGRHGVVAGAHEALRHATELVRRPRRVTAAALASAATTVVLSAGFLLTVLAWGRAANPLPAGAVVAVYLVASAIGGATPLPPFLGVTEAALVGGLVLGGYTSASAILCVVVFRAMTYWLPLPVGVLAAHHLRRANLL
jgi:uncharacterized membrane protein YbhN (UPF0104 family)